jgi:hypothetical protein
MKTISNITLYELMAQGLDVWVSRSNKQGFKIEIDGEDGQSLVCDEPIHPYAAESFADFCRSYLASYDRVIEQDNNIGARNA